MRPKILLAVAAAGLLLCGCASVYHERPTEFGLEKSSFKSCLMMGSASKISVATKDGSYSRRVSVGNVQGQGDAEMLKAGVEAAVKAGIAGASGSRTAVDSDLP